MASYCISSTYGVIWVILYRATFLFFYGFVRFPFYSRRKVYDYEQIVVTPVHPGVETCSAQLNEENEDFSGRRRYHQTATVTGQYVNTD